MAGGYYNHYDDPDEFWDEEPLEPEPKTFPAVQNPHHPLSPPPSLSPAPPATPAHPVPPPRPFNPPPIAAPADPDLSQTSSLRGSPFSTSGTTPSQTPDSEGLDKLLNDLAQFHGYTQAISGLMQEVFAAGPSHVTGRDRTGAVEVFLTGTGELARIIVSDNWRRYLDPSGIGTAVVNAVKDAERTRFESACTTAVENGTIDRLETLSMNDVAPTKFTPPEPTPSPAVGTEQLLEETLQLLNSNPDEATLGEFVGTAGSEDDLYASITLSQNSIADCVVRIPWGMEAAGSSIAWAVKESYDQAHHRRLATGNDSAASTFGTLANDAIQTLVNMQIRSPEEKW
ncbi:hypothetical protein ACW2Q0_02610 [Nocardia sp. R16R-3T]